MPARSYFVTSEVHTDITTNAEKLRFRRGTPVTFGMARDRGNYWRRHSGRQTNIAVRCSSLYFAIEYRPKSGPRSLAMQPGTTPRCRARFFPEDRDSRKIGSCFLGRATAWSRCWRDSSPAVGSGVSAACSTAQAKVITGKPIVYIIAGDGEAEEGEGRGFACQAHYKLQPPRHADRNHLPDIITETKQE